MPKQTYLRVKRDQYTLKETSKTCDVCPDEVLWYAKTDVYVCHKRPMCMLKERSNVPKTCSG